LAPSGVSLFLFECTEARVAKSRALHTLGGAGCPDHGSADLGCFKNIVLLDDRQDIAAEFAHLPIVFLDHPDASGNFERSGGFFEDGDFWDDSGQ
jgi:hypothetical protein